MPHVLIEISRDFGDWQGIESFRWDAYATELAEVAREVLDMPDAEVSVQYTDFPHSGVMVDGFTRDDEGWLLEQMFHNVDATCERFYGFYD